MQSSFAHSSGSNSSYSSSSKNPRTSLLTAFSPGEIRNSRRRVRLTAYPSVLNPSRTHFDFSNEFIDYRTIRRNASSTRQRPKDFCHEFRIRFVKHAFSVICDGFRDGIDCIVIVFQRESRLADRPRNGIELRCGETGKRNFWWDLMTTEKT